MEEAGEVLRVSNLCKALSPTFRLEGISFRLARRRGLALIGGNGAGKSTLLRILAGLTRPDSGELSLRGAPSARGDKAGARVGFVQQLKSLPDDLTLGDYVRHQLRLRRVGLERYHDLMQRAGLERFEDALATQLSGGNQRKVHIICAVAQAPDLLVLDEPTSGLDAQAREELLRLIQGLKANGMSLVVASHHLEEVRALAEEALLLRDGRQVATTTVEELIAGGARARCLELQLQHPEADVARLAALFEGQGGEGAWAPRAVEGGADRVRLHYVEDGADPLPRAVALLAQHGIRLASVRHYEPTLAEIVARLTRQPIPTPAVLPKEPQ